MKLINNFFDEGDDVVSFLIRSGLQCDRIERFLIELGCKKGFDMPLSDVVTRRGNEYPVYMHVFREGIRSCDFEIRWDLSAHGIDKKKEMERFKLYIFGGHKLIDLKYLCF